MERLTKYLASGAADYNYPAGCYSGNDCNDRVAKSAYRQTCVERLAAYEETGLTPEESKRMSNILMDVGIDYNCSWEYVKNWLLDDRLRELDEADKDGRLVGCRQVEEERDYMHQQWSNAEQRANYAESHPWRNLWVWVKRKVARHE